MGRDARLLQGNEKEGPEKDAQKKTAVKALIFRAKRRRPRIGITRETVEGNSTVTADDPFKGNGLRKGGVQRRITQTWWGLFEGMRKRCISF